MKKRSIIVKNFRHLIVYKKVTIMETLHPRIERCRTIHGFGKVRITIEGVK